MMTDAGQMSVGAESTTVWGLKSIVALVVTVLCVHSSKEWV